MRDCHSQSAAKPHAISASPFSSLDYANTVHLCPPPSLRFDTTALMEPRVSPTLSISSSQSQPEDEERFKPEPDEPTEAEKSAANLELVILWNSAEPTNDGLGVMSMLIRTLDYCVSKYKAHREEEAAAALAMQRKTEADMKALSEEATSSSGINRYGSAASSNPNMMRKGSMQMQSNLTNTGKQGRKGCTESKKMSKDLLPRASSMPDVKSQRTLLATSGGEDCDEDSDYSDANSEDESDDEGPAGPSWGSAKPDMKAVNAKIEAKKAMKLERRNSRRASKAAVNVPTEFDEMNAKNEFVESSFLDMARDCLVNCVMALDADEDGGCRIVLRKPDAQKVICEALSVLENDKEGVTAGCMLIRQHLRSGASQRLEQTNHLIECGLAEAITKVLEVHVEDVGKLNTECSAMIEVLGHQFERQLPGGVRG